MNDCMNCKMTDEVLAQVRYTRRPSTAECTLDTIAQEFELLLRLGHWTCHRNEGNWLFVSWLYW